MPVPDHYLAGQLRVWRHVAYQQWLEVCYIQHNQSLCGFTEGTRHPRGIGQVADHGKYAAEYEFYMFRAPGSSNDNSQTAKHILNNDPTSLPHLTEGMMGYSLFDPVRNQEWYYSVFNQCEAFDCGIEGWHTESGPGVYEAVSLSSRLQTC